jgi:hypothetical protein
VGDVTTRLSDLARSTRSSAAERVLDQGQGVVRLAPTWIPRSFCVPGRRLKLHPDDYFAFGGERGGIDERWLSSAVHADNGPLAGADEALSFAVAPDAERVAFDELVGHLGAKLIGPRLWTRYGACPVISKLFDNQDPQPFHLHHTDDKAALVGRVGKPEAYYFLPQMNNLCGALIGAARPPCVS